MNTLKRLQKDSLLNFLYTLLLNIIGVLFSLPFVIFSVLIANNLDGSLIEKLIFGMIIGLIFALTIKPIHDNKIFKSSTNFFNFIFGYINGYAGGYGIMLTYNLEISTTNLIIILSIFLTSNILIFALFLKCIGINFSMQDLYKYLKFVNLDSQ